MTGEYVIHTDGASRGNPGPAAYAYTIEPPGEPAVEVKECLGPTTNNIAEYTAIIRSLEHAQRLGARRVVLYSDSELIINQLSGVYKVKHPGLLPLYQQAIKLRRSFDHVTIRHVRRENNVRADELCNEALDAAGGRKSTPATKSLAHSDDPMRRDLERLVREDALACLETGADAWSRGDDGSLQPEHIWDQLWSILVDAGVLKKRK